MRKRILFFIISLISYIITLEIFFSFTKWELFYFSKNINNFTDDNRALIIVAFVLVQLILNIINKKDKKNE